MWYLVAIGGVGDGGADGLLHLLVLAGGVLTLPRHAVVIKELTRRLKVRHHQRNLK